MNFMKNSLFQRNLEQEREEEMPEEGGVLAVWGSPSSGKTVVSVKLAEHLAKKKRNVILILADMITPPLPYLCAPSDIEQERSLGKHSCRIPCDGKPHQEELHVLPEE